MARFQLKSGQAIDIPASITTKGGRQDYAMQRGATPEEVGLTAEIPDAGGTTNQVFTGMGKFLADRGIHMPGTDTRIEAPDTAAAMVGAAALPVAAGAGLAMIPGAQGLGAQIALQGAGAAALEFAREGSDAQSTAVHGVLGGGGALAGQILARAGSGALTRFTANRAGRPIAFPKGNRGTIFESMGRFSQGAGGLNSAVRAQVSAINRAAGRVFGLADDASREIDEVFLQGARQNVNMLYRAAQPTAPVNVAKSRALLGDLQRRGVQSAKLDKLMAMSDDVIDPREFQSFHRTMRDISSELKHDTVYRGLAEYVDDAVSLADDAAALAGGDRALLGAANQKFKLLATLEEINTVVEAGEIPAGELVRKMGRDGFKGFGKRLVAEGTGRERLLPEIAELLDMGKTIADFTRRTAGGSATAGRTAGIAPIFSAAGAFVRGSPLEAAAGLTSAAAMRLPGLASIGSPGAGAIGGAIGGAGGQGGASLLDDL